MYRNAYWDRNKIRLATWDTNGNRVRVECPWQPYLYIDSPNGDAVSIFNKPLEKKYFASPKDRNNFVYQYGSKRYYDNIDVANQFLLDVFWKYCKTPEFTKNPLRILFFDIEVDPNPNGDFPDPNKAETEINLITVYDTLEERYHTYAKHEYTGTDLLPNAVFHYCKDEKDVLRSFINFWKLYDYPDIVTAWNLNGFDMTYFVNRVIKQLGVSYYYELSPYGIVRERKSQDKMKHDVTKYDIAGLQNLDMIDVYIKFKGQKQESYKLDFIGEKELGIGKLDYSGIIKDFIGLEWDGLFGKTLESHKEELLKKYGETSVHDFLQEYWEEVSERFTEEARAALERRLRHYDSLDIYGFMRTFWNRFVEYNVRDVEIMVKLEQQLRHFKLLRKISCMTCVNFDKTLGTIAVTNSGLSVLARSRGQVLHTFIRDTQKAKKPGGFVSSNTGIYESVVTVDASSLYPNLVISNNISPETKIAMVHKRGTTAFDFYDEEDDSKLTLSMVNGDNFTMTKKEIRDWVFSNDLIISCNGCIFRQDVEGILPQFMREVFEDRVAVRARIKKINKETEELEKELAYLEKQGY